MEKRKNWKKETMTILGLKNKQTNIFVSSTNLSEVSELEEKTLLSL
jgi:hypothetical protein